VFIIIFYSLTNFNIRMSFELESLIKYLFVLTFVKFYQISSNFAFCSNRFQFSSILFNLILFLLTLFKSLTTMNSDGHVSLCDFFYSFNVHVLT